MGDFMSVNPNFVQAIKDSFAKQGLMSHIGARLGAIRPGYVEIALPYSEAVSQQHGFFHGGVVAAIGESAGGYAAFSLMDAGDGVLTVEYKVNLVGDYALPPWFGDAQFHASHRAALLYKNYAWYKQFGWSERPALAYFWPASGLASSLSRD